MEVGRTSILLTTFSTPSDRNRRNGTQLVLTQNLVPIDGPVSSPADLVVVHGGGQDLDIVDDFLNTFNALYNVFSIGLQRGTRDLAHERHRTVGVNLVREVIEHAVEGEHHEFVTDLLDDAIDALLIDRASWLVVQDGGTGESHHRENQ